MDISHRGLVFIMGWESLKLAAYYDQAGIPTIGYGTICYPNGQKVQITDVCTEQQAQDWLHWELQGVVAAVNTVTAFVTLSQNMFDALCAFVYNVGIGGFKESTLRRKLVAREPIVEDYFLRWNKVHDPKTGKLVVSQGLTNRRTAEFALFSEV